MNNNKEFTNLKNEEKNLSPLEVGEKLVYGKVLKKNYPRIIKKESLPSERAKEFTNNIKSVNELLKIKLKETPYIVDGLVIEEDINAITAKTGVGKSLFVLKMAEAIDEGKPFLDQYKTQKKKVLILDLEMSEHSIVDRVQTVIENKDCGINIFYKNNFDFGNKNDIEILIEKIREENFGVLIVDTFSAAHLKEENSNTEMAQILQEMRRVINKTNCTIIFLHHHGKGNAYKNSDKGRGATAIADKLSSYVSLTGEKKYDDQGRERLYLTITQEKNREKYSVKPFNVEIFWDSKINKTIFSHTGYIVKEETTAIKTTAWILSIFPGFEKYTKKEIIEIGKTQEFGNSSIRNALHILTEQGILKSKIYPELSKKAKYYYKKEDNPLFENNN